MFSENDRISSRQTKYLIMMEMTAKCCILLPALLAGKNTGSIVVCLVLGIWLWCFVLKRILKWMEPGGDFFDVLVRLGGTGTAVLIYFAGFWYFLAHSAVFLNLCGELARMYLLPDIPIPILCLLPFLVAVCFGLGSVEVRGRFCEAAGPVLAVLLGLLIFLAGFGMEAYQYEETVIRPEDFIFRGSFEVFAAVGGMFLPLLAVHLTEKESPSTFGRAIRRGGCMGMVTAGCLCAVTAASYGKNGLGEVPFASVRVMSNVHLPGGFLQRWDIIFLSVLMFSLVVTVGGSFWYLKEILFRIWEEIRVWREKTQQKNGAETGQDSVWNGKKVPMILWILTVVPSCFAASGFLSADTAIACYRAYNIQILIPVLTLFYIAFGFRKRKKCARIPAVLALLLLCGLTLCGCTAREPEERLFPMALEVGVTGKREKEILLTCAWDKENNSEVLTEFQGASMEEIENRMEEYTERYIDFSHVKALILDEDLKEELPLYEEVIRWLMEESSFASGLTVYPASESGLTLSGVQEKADTDVGTYLEMLYRSRKKYRDTSTTLGKVIAEYCAKSIL